MSPSRSRSSSAIKTFIHTSCFGRLGRERYAEARAAGVRARRADLTAVAVDDRLRDPQPEPESARLRLDVGAAPEALEDRLVAAVRHAGAFVFHPRGDAAVRRAR